MVLTDFLHSANRTGPAFAVEVRLAVPTKIRPAKTLTITLVVLLALGMDI